MEKIIIVGGLTASGKTAFATNLAKKLDSAIISADSMQIYKGFDIGTAKEKDENLGVKQYCIDITTPKKPFSIYDYKNEAEDAIAELISLETTPIICGGTGFYINSLIYKLDYGGFHDMVERKRLEEQLEKEGIVPLYEQLKKLDPISAAQIHPNNSRKVIRALEVTLGTGKPFSSQCAERIPNRQIEMHILIPERKKIYQKIEERVEKMFNMGLESEVKGLLNSGITFDDQPMLGIGYKEFKGYFEGEVSLSEVKELIKRNTRRYAKRQETWFKNQYNSLDVKFYE